MNTNNTKLQNQQKLQFEVMDTKALQTCVVCLRNAIDKATSKGCYNLQETESFIISLNSLLKSVDVLDSYQKFVTNKFEDQQKNNQNTKQSEKSKSKEVVFNEEDEKLLQ